MADEVTFIDLACLLRITQDTTLEKLGSAINSSIFDASNIAGTLKKDGLIDFSAYYPGPNTVTVTDAGKALIAEADGKATEPFDNLDDAVLFQLSGGKRNPNDLQSSLNLRPKDLALRLYKLTKQGFISYELRSGSADITLTESGFLKAKSSTITRPPLQPSQAGAAVAQAAMSKPEMPAQPHQEPQANQPAADPNAPIKLHGKPHTKMMFAIVIIVILIIVVVALFYTGMLSGV